MRATLDYFEAKEDEIRRMEDTPTGVPTTPSAVLVPRTPMKATVSPATPVNARKAECKKTKPVGPEDGILLKCTREYIEDNFFTGQAEPILPYIKPKNKTHMGDTYNIQINGGDFIAGGGSKTVNQYSGQALVETPKPSGRFAYIDLIRCTQKEGQEAEEMLRQVAQKSPKEIAGVVHRLIQAQRLRPIDSIAGFVREFNNHFGVRLNEQSFYSAFSR